MLPFDDCQRLGTGSTCSNEVLATLLVFQVVLTSAIVARWKSGCENISFIFLNKNIHRSFAFLGAFEDRNSLRRREKLPKCHLRTFLQCLHSGPQSFPLAVALPPLFAFKHFIYVFIYELFWYSHRLELQKIIKICDSANSLLISLLRESIIFMS